jgi:uncharacterized protein YodC (DUF2158 family)
MSDKPFNVGDVVRLKSGGPRMTVTECDLDNFDVMTVWCAWFEGVKAHEGTFPALAVERI